MELTIDQALKKGVEAHKVGQVEEADKYYTAILKAQPKHPDANHNMGVLAVGVGKVEQTIPFFLSSSVNKEILLNAPRILKDLTSWRSSLFTQILELKNSLSLSCL